MTPRMPRIASRRGLGLVLSAAVAVAACIEEEGSVGGLPEGWRADTFVQWHEERRLPGSMPGRPMACSDIWDLGAEAYDVVETCEGYDFTTLYAQAVADGEAIARDRPCDEACADRSPVTQVGGAVFWCTGGEAHAAVWIHFLCRRDETEVFPWAARPASAFTPQPVPERPTARPASPVEFFAGARAVVACGSTRRINFNHERVFGDRACASLDLENIRDLARGQARQEWERYSCAAGCAKQPFAPLLERWRCSEGPDRDANKVPDVVDVNVDVSFEVACR